MAEDKTRFRFRKEAELRLLSHHDLARAFERLLRRAGLPFDSTGGFHPTPRLVFALSMPLGAVGLDEVVEIEWKSPVEPEEALAQLNVQSPPGIVLFSARRIPVKASAKPRRVEYELALPAEWLETAKSRVLALSDGSDMWMERTRPRHKRIDIRPFVDLMEIVGDRLRFSFWVTGNGTAKADEVARLLDLGPLLDNGAPWTRTKLELHDEVTAEEAARTPKIEAREVVLSGQPAPDPREKELAAASAEWGASSDGPVVE